MRSYATDFSAGQDGDRPVPEELVSLLHYADDRSGPLHRWRHEQELEHLNPMAGDAVDFCSHISRLGAMVGSDPEGEIRESIVLH